MILHLQHLHHLLLLALLCPVKLQYSYQIQPIIEQGLSATKAQYNSTEIKEDMALGSVAMRDINGKTHSSLNMDAISKLASPTNVSSPEILFYGFRPVSDSSCWFLESVWFVCIGNQFDFYCTQDGQLTILNFKLVPWQRQDINISFFLSLRFLACHSLSSSAS